MNKLVEAHNGISCIGPEGGPLKLWPLGPRGVVRQVQESW